MHIYMSSVMKTQLVLILVFTRTIDVVEAELVDVFRRRDNPNPVTKGVLLQELFCQIFEVAFGQGYAGGDGELGVAITSNFDVVAELASLAIDLDAVVQELFEIRTIEDTVTGRLREVDDEFMLRSRSFSGGGLGHLDER